MLNFNMQMFAGLRGNTYDDEDLTAQQTSEDAHVQRIQAG